MGGEGVAREEDLAPAVRSILDAAAERGGGDRVAVEARSLPEAFAAAEADGRVPVIAEAMVAGGASALSVLTEPEHFGGTPLWKARGTY